jgi:type IV pilus assembly protein PilA
VRVLHSLTSRRDEEEGFTLIELMVVVMIIAILITIAIPVFLGARQRAQNSAAKADLRNATAAAKVYFTDGETYVGMSPTALETIEPSLTYDVLASASTTVVGVGDLSTTGFVMNRQSKTNDWYCVAETSSGTQYGRLQASDAASCTGGWG